MQPFDSSHRTRLIFGEGKLELLGQLARSLRAQSALIVSDQGILEAGHHDRAEKSLAEPNSLEILQLVANETILH